jgi:hypothetical protein
MTARLQRPELAAECAGCGAIAELVQDSDYCWDCTYDPPCLCAGRPGATTDTQRGGPHGRYA